MNESGMALQQHLGHPRRTAEIAVNLKGRMRIPQVVQCPVLQQIAIEFIGVVAVVQPRPQVQFPPHAPARCEVTAKCQHDAGRIGQCGSGNGGNRMSRMEAEEMIDVPMRIFGVVYVPRPLHQLSIASDSVRNHVGEDMAPFAPFVRVDAEDFRCLDGILQHLANHGMNESRPLVHGPVFGRGGGRGRIGAVLPMP